MGRHVATSVGRRSRASGRADAPRCRPARALLSWTAALAVVVLVGVTGAGGSLAYLSRAVASPGATLTAGSAAFTVTASAPLAAANLSPGSAATTGTYTLTNTGDVPLTIGLDSVAVGTATPLTGALVLDLAVHPAGTTCATASYTQWRRSGTTVTGTLAGTLAARDRLVAGSPHPTAVLCARASLPSTAPDAAKGSSASLTITVSGTQTGTGGWQAPNRTATATATTAAIALTLGNTAALSTTAATTSWLVAPLTISNAGGAPLAYTLAATTTGSPTLPGLTRLALWAPGTTTCAATPPAAAVVGTVASPPALPAGAASGAAGTALTLCAATQLTTTVATAQGKSFTATFTVTGRVGSNWVTTGSGQLSQRVAWANTCTTQALAAGIVISWAPVTGATAYKVYDDDGALVATLGASATSVRLNFSAGGLPGFPVYAIGDTAFVRVAPVEGSAESVGTTTRTQPQTLIGSWQTCQS